MAAGPRDKSRERPPHEVRLATSWLSGRLRPEVDDRTKCDRAPPCLGSPDWSDNRKCDRAHMIRVPSSRRWSTIPLPSPMHRQTNPGPIQQINHPPPLKTTPKIPIQPYTQPPSHPLTPTNPQGLAPTSPRGPAAMGGGKRHQKQTTPNENPSSPTHEESCDKVYENMKKGRIKTKIAEIIENLKKSA